MAQKDKKIKNLPCEIPLLPIQPSTSIIKSHPSIADPIGTRLAEHGESNHYVIRRTKEQISSSMQKYPAVEVCGASYSFGKGANATRALHDATLKIPRGAIYSLLGPSGCGKTTLLSSLVGLRRLHSGWIHIFGVPPGHPDCGVPGSWIGYMPQELCLYMALTVEETLHYFGGLQRMTANEIRKNMVTLVKLLDLPKDFKRPVNKLSGGQQRRLSLAVALIHGPPLIILDEPTVGVDPLLRRAIWQHLFKLVANSGKTICITTHYIEEARNAHVVGFMRNGTIIKEAEPTAIMNELGQDTLEKVFLILCSKKEPEAQNEEESLLSENQIKVIISEPSTSSQACLPSPTYADTVYILPASRQTLKDYIYQIFIFTLKNITLLKRNFLILIIIFGTPMGNIFGAKYAFGHTPWGLPVAVVNNEKPPELSKLFVENLDLEILKSKIYNSSNMALESVKDGTSWASVHVPENFTVCLLERMFLGLSADEDTIKGGSIRVNYDNSNIVIASTIFMSLLKSFTSFARANIEHSHSHPKIIEPALTFEKPVFGTWETEFTEYAMASILTNSLFLTSLSFTALVFVSEKSNNLLDRSRVSGLTPMQVLFSHALINNFISVIQIIALMLVTSAVYQNAIGSLGLVGFLCFLQGNVGMILGFLVSASCTHSYSALLLVSVIYQVDATFNGLMWPVEGFPLWFRPIARCSPGSSISLAVRYVLYQGIGFTSKYVWIAILSSIAWTLLPLLILIYLFGRH